MTVRREIAQSRRVAPIATKRNGYPALRREEEAYRGPVALHHATGEEYVDRLSGEPARHTKLRLTRCVRSNRSGWAIAAEALMNNPG